MRKSLWLKNILKYLWMIPILAPLGMGSFLSFIFIGLFRRKIKWLIVGFIYFISVYGLLVTLGSIEDDENWVGPITIIILSIWIASFIHAVRVNRKLFLTSITDKKELQHDLRQQVYTKEEISMIQQTEMKERNDDRKLNRSSAQTQIININKASEEKISALPGVHSFLAQAIVQTRERPGHFKNIGELSKSINVKPHILNAALPYIVFTDDELKTRNKEKEAEKLEQQSMSNTRKIGRRVEY